MPEDAPVISPDDEHWSDKLNQSSDQEYDETYPKVPRDDHHNNGEASNQQYEVAPQEMGVFGEYYHGESVAGNESKAQVGAAAADLEPQQPVVDEPDSAAAVGDKEEGKNAAFEESTDKSEEGDEEETAKFEVDTILQILLRNFSRNKIQNVRLRFDPQNAKDANYNVPAAELNQRVSTQTDQTFMRF